MKVLIHGGGTIEGVSQMNPNDAGGFTLRFRGGGSTELDAGTEFDVIDGGAVDA